METPNMIAAHELMLAEAKKRERAHYRERALSNLMTVEKAIEKGRRKLDKFREQLAICDAFEALIPKVDKTLPGPGGYLIRDRLAAFVGALRANQERQLEDGEAALERMTRELPRMRKAVEDLTD